MFNHRLRSARPCKRWRGEGKKETDIDWALSKLCMHQISVILDLQRKAENESGRILDPDQTHL